MNYWIRFGCFLTGWNTNILKQCTEASYKHLKKYTSALLILILMWGFTGYCFAQRYVHAPIIGCIAASIFFIVLVVQIERQIILTVGSNKVGAIFRFFIAIIMSILGSSIIDQIIFGQDIERKMVEITDRQVQEQLPMRLNVIDAKLAELHDNIDSLNNIMEHMNEEVSQKPLISAPTMVTGRRAVPQPDGSVKWVQEKTVTNSSIPNPKIEQIKTYQTEVNHLRKQEADYSKKKLSTEQDLRTELAGNVGFLEELNAMYELITSRPMAMAFYLIVFSFLISLELFVVTSKLSDKKCDYEMIVEYQLAMKKNKLDELGRK